MALKADVDVMVDFMIPRLQGWCHHTALKADVGVMDRGFVFDGANVDGASHLQK